MADDFMKNFAIMIPTYGMHYINGCAVFEATGEEFNKFKAWVEEGNIVQLKNGSMWVDVWLQQNDLGRDFMDLNDWFIRWKTPPTLEVHTYQSFSV